MSTHNICFYGEHLTEAILMSTNNMFLWRAVENYLSIIIKYPFYLLHYSVCCIPLRGYTLNAISGTNSSFPLAVQNFETTFYLFCCNVIVADTILI